MAESAEELVERCYRRLAERKGITKGAGSAAVGYHELTAEVVAEVGVAWRKQLKRNEKALRANGRKLAKLAASYGAATGPRVRGVGEIQQGLVDLDLERYGVQLAGRNLPDDGGPWYPGHSVNPENDGN